MTPLVELRWASKVYILPSGSRLEILSEVDLSLERGEVVAIVGKSGSGKSTLLNILGLIDRPTSGSLLIDGVDTEGLRDCELARLRGRFVGFVFQQFHLLERRTALENVAEPLLYGSRTDRTTRASRALELLSLVGLRERAGSMPHLLSGGEQQRITIARAMVRRPRLLLADEPTGALDADTGEIVLDLLIDLARAEKVTLVLVTHDPMVDDRADRVLALDAGRLTKGHLSWGS